MNEFDVVAVIERPAEEVFAALTDVTKIPVWTPGLTEARTSDGTPVTIGSVIIFTGSFLGRSYESIAECIAFEPGRRFASKTTSGPFHLDVDQRLEPTDGATRVISHYVGESRGFFKLGEPVVIRLTRRLFENAHENLKALVEGGAL